MSEFDDAVVEALNKVIQNDASYPHGFVTGFVLAAAYRRNEVSFGDTSIVIVATSEGLATHETLGLLECIRMGQFITVEQEEVDDAPGQDT